MSLLEEGVGRKEEQKTTNSFTLTLQKLEKKKKRKVELCRKELLSLVDTVKCVKSTSQGIHRETQGC